MIAPFALAHGILPCRASSARLWVALAFRIPRAYIEAEAEAEAEAKDGNESG